MEDYKSQPPTVIYNSSKAGQGRAKGLFLAVDLQRELHCSCSTVPLQFSQALSLQFLFALFMSIPKLTQELM